MDLSSKTHDDMIRESTRWAESLGYKVVEQHFGTKTGADAIIQNLHGEKVVLEIVTGSSFKNLFRKKRIKKALENDLLVGLIIVGDRIDHLMNHGQEAGLSIELFESGNKKQKIFGVLTRHFNDVIPVLLVSILGTRGSPYRVRVID